ncbi:MAG: NRDE family protein [Planctomycetes bacterium]|nr:NRDE family protein [Planctomycetota bacterium]
MCLVILLFRPEEEFPLLLAANRDEFYDRPGESPQLLSASPKIWGGRDPRAGGTWLGVNEHGLVVALTDGPPESFVPDRRSRGLLCLEALHASSLAHLRNWLKEECRQSAYNRFNLVASNGREAWAAYGPETIRTESLSPGLHLLANRPSIDDPETPKLRRCRQLLSGIEGEGAVPAVRRLMQACADHGDGGPDAACVHGVGRGTLSSSLLALHRSGLASSRYLHVNAHPCEAAFEDWSPLFRGGCRGAPLRALDSGGQEA